MRFAGPSYTRVWKKGTHRVPWSAMLLRTRQQLPAMAAPTCLGLLVALCADTAGATLAARFSLSSTTGDVDLPALLEQSARGRDRRGAEDQTDTIALHFVVDGTFAPCSPPVTLCATHSACFLVARCSCAPARPSPSTSV